MINHEPEASIRIALNLANLRGHGSSVLGRSMLAALATSPHEFLAWVPSTWRDEHGGGSGRMALRHIGPGGLAKLAADTLRIPRALDRWRADRLFSLGDTGVPRARVPQLLLVQQAYLAYPPDRWGFAVPLRFRAKLALMSSYFRIGLPAVTRFSVQSEHMRAELAARWRISPDRIAVIPSGLDLPGGVQPDKSSVPYVCCIATSAPHKNLAVLAEMMAALAVGHRDLRCKVTVHSHAVPRLADAAARVGVFERFDFVGSLSREASLSLLAGAVVSVIPSLLESFGMTYYESMALGIPVVAADVLGAREACGDAALYAAPHSGESFAAQVARTLGSAAASHGLVEAGRSRVRSLVPSWSEVGRQHLALIERL